MSSENTSLPLLTFGLLLMGTLLTIVATMYTTHRAYPASTDEAVAQDRLDTLNQIFIQTFGTRWRTLVLGFVLFLSVLMVVVCWRTAASKSTYTLADRGSLRVIFVTFCLFVVSVIGVIASLLLLYGQPNTNTF